MSKLWPTKKQYEAWSMPSKLTFISAYLGIATLVFSILSATFGYIDLTGDQRKIVYSLEEEGHRTNILLHLEDNNSTKVIYSGTYLKIVRIEDFDFDGIEDLLFSQSNGGNCCPPYYQIVSSRGGGYVKVFDNVEFSSHSEPEIVLSNNRWLFRITQDWGGIGNTVQSEARLTFSLVEGELREIERLELDSRPEIPSKVELKSTYYTDEEGREDDVISLSYDLNRDGSLDTVDCKYWERWGSLSCEAKINEQVSNISIGCHRIGVTAEVKGEYHALVCNRDTLIYFDIEAGKYK